MTTWMQSLQMHEILIYGLVFGLPVVAIGFSAVESIVKAIVKSLIKHHERMAMIQYARFPAYHSEHLNVDKSSAPRPGNVDETQPCVPRK